MVDPAIKFKLETLRWLLMPHEFSLRISRRNVPHLVSAKRISVCYFKKTDMFRVFTNYATDEEQQKFDAKTEQDVIDIINKL